MHAISKIIQAPGILAASCGQRGSQEFVFAKDVPQEDRDRLQGMINHLCEALEASPLRQEDEIKAVLSGETVMVRRNADMHVGVVVTKGHPVVKSLQRMVRKAFRDLDAPLKPSTGGPREIHGLPLVRPR